MKVSIHFDDLSSEVSQSIVREHMTCMLANSPIESFNALPLDKLRQPNITFWSAWIRSKLCGFGAPQRIAP
jgi:putative acetyltransferase